MSDMNRYIRRSTKSGAIVIVEQRLNLSDCASYRKPEISMVSVPRSLTLADARELAAALTQAVEQAEAWEQPRDEWHDYDTDSEENEGEY